MAAALNTDMDLDQARSDEDKGANTKHELGKKNQLWWSLSPSGDRITICLPEDPLSPDHSRPSTSSPAFLCDCGAVSGEHVCDQTVEHNCHLSVPCERDSVENCHCECLKTWIQDLTRENDFDLTSNYDCDISSAYGEETCTSEICSCGCKVGCCVCTCGRLEENNSATKFGCKSNHSKDLAYNGHHNHGGNDCKIQNEKHNSSPVPTDRNLHSFHKCLRPCDVAHRNNCKRYEEHRGLRQLSERRTLLESEPNVRTRTNTPENRSGSVYDESWSSKEKSLETNSTLDFDVVPETDRKDVTVQVTLKFEGGRPVVSSPKFILRKPETQENMEEEGGSVKLSPMRPKVRFVEDQKKNLERQTEDGRSGHIDVSVHNEDTSQEISSPEDVKEGIDNTLKEIYELRKLLAELKHEKLGLNIPNENFKVEEEFQFQPDEICPSSTPVNNSSRESIDDLQNLLDGMSSPKNNADAEFVVNQSGSGIPLGHSVANGEAGQSARVEGSQSGARSPENPSQSMKDHLTEGQSDPAIPSLAAASDTASKPVVNSSKRAKKQESAKNTSEARPKSLVTPRKRIILSSASSNTLQVPEFEPNRRVLLTQPDQSSSYFNWSSTGPHDLGEEPRAQHENHGDSSDSESPSFHAEEAISKELIGSSKPPDRSSVQSAVLEEFTDFNRPPSRHSIRPSDQPISADHVQTSRPPSRRSVRTSVKPHDFSNLNENSVTIDAHLSKLSNERATDNVSVYNTAKPIRKLSAQSIRDFASSTHVYEPVPDNSVITPIDKASVKYHQSPKKLSSKSSPRSYHAFDNATPESRSSVFVIDKSSKETKRSESRSSVFVLNKPPKEPKRSDSKSSVIVLDKPFNEPKRPESRSSIIVLDKPPKEPKRSDSKSSVIVLDKPFNEPKRPESRSSVIVLDKPSKEPKRSESRSSIIVLDKPSKEPKRSESRSSVTVLEKPFNEPKRSESRSSIIVLDKPSKEQKRSESRSSVIVLDKPFNKPKRSESRSSIIVLDKPSKEQKRSESRSSVIELDKPSKEPKRSESRSSVIVLDKPFTESKRSESRSSVIVIDKPSSESRRSESTSSVTVIDKPSSEPKRPESRSSAIVVGAPNWEQTRPESRSSVIVLERPISTRKFSHFRSSSVTELPRIVKERDRLSSALSTRSVKSITHRYTPDLKPAIRVINPTPESKSKRDIISVKSVSFKLKNKPQKYVRSVSDGESSDSETETVFLVPLKSKKPIDLLEVPTSLTGHQTEEKAPNSAVSHTNIQDENNRWSVQVVDEKQSNETSEKSPPHSTNEKSQLSSRVSTSDRGRNKTKLDTSLNEPSASGYKSGQENDARLETKTGRDKNRTSTPKPDNIREGEISFSIPLNTGEDPNKLSFKPASAIPKRLISNRKEPGTVSARVTRDEKQSVRSLKRTVPEDKSLLPENRASLRRNRSGLSNSRLNVNKNLLNRSESPLALRKHQNKRTDSRLNLNKSSVSRADSRLSINHPRDSRANSRLSLNKTPISRSNSRASLLKNRRTDSRLSLNRSREDKTSPRRRAVSSSPQPSISSIRRKKARKISLENITKRTENRVRERSLSRSRDQNPIRAESPKPASYRASPKLPSTARKQRAGLVTAPVLTNSRTRTAISHRSISSYSHRPKPFRKSSPSPERYKRNINKSARGRSPVANRSSAARKSRSRSVRHARHSPKKSLTRSISSLSMKNTAKKPEVKRSRSLSTRRKSNPKKYELKVECEPAEPERKSSFNLDLVKNVKNKLKQVPSNVRGQASNNTTSQTYFGISGSALASQSSQNAYRPLDSHFEENILLGEPYTSRGGAVPIRRGNIGNLQAFSRPQHQPPMQKPRVYDNHMRTQRPAQFGYGGGRRSQLYRKGLGAWFRKWNPFRNLFGGPRPYPVHMRPKPNYGYERSREFENLVPRKPPMSKTNSSQQLFIQDPKNSGKIMIAEEVGLVYGDPREILQKEKKKTEVAKGFLASLRKSSLDKKAAAAGAAKDNKRKKPRAKSKERKSRSGFNRNSSDSSSRKSMKSRLGFSRRKGSAKSVKSAKPKKKKKVRLSLADIAKRVQQNSRMSSSTSSGKRTKFATEGKLDGFGTVAKTAIKNKSIFTKKSTNLGPDGTPKSILRGPPTQQFSTDPTATRPVHFRPGTIPAVNEIPRYAQASPQPLTRASLPPQPNKVRLDAMASNTMASEGRGQFYGRLHSGATRRQAEQSGAHYGPPSGPPSRVPVPSEQGMGGRHFPLALPSLKRAPRPNPAQRSAAGDTAIDMPSMHQAGSPPRHSAAADARMDSGGPGPPILGGAKKEPKVPIVLMQGVFNRAAANTSLARRAALEVEGLPLPPSLVEPTSRLRGALPVLPPSFASLCLCLNICIPGLGTMVSGWLGLCVGRNRLAPEETPRTRGMSVLITMGTGLAQLAAVSFFLVGWFWSIAWGLLLVSISQKYLAYIDDHAKTMQGAVGLEMMSVNASAPDKPSS